MVQCFKRKTLLPAYNIVCISGKGLPSKRKPKREPDHRINSLLRNKWSYSICLAYLTQSYQKQVPPLLYIFRRSFASASSTFFFLLSFLLLMILNLVVQFHDFMARNSIYYICIVYAKRYALVSNSAFRLY